MPQSTAVIPVNMGLYLNRQPLEVPLSAVQDGNNFRVFDGELTNDSIGYITSGDPQLNGPITLIYRFQTRTLGDHTVIGTPSDLYHKTTSGITYLTPRYAVGTVAVSGATPAVVTGTGTDWSPLIRQGDQISFGNNAQNSLTATWYTIDIVTDDTHLTLTTAVAGAPIGAGSQYTIRRLFQPGAEDIWDVEPFINDPAQLDWLYITNGADPIYRWDGTSTQVTPSAVTGFTCKHLAVYSNMMLYMNLLQSGDTLSADLVNSNVGDPEDVTTGLSEQFKVHDEAGEIVGARRIGDNLAIYSKRNVVLAQFIGGDVVFVFRKVVANAGPLSPRLVVDFGDYHEFIHNDNMYRFDGASVARMNDHIWQAVLRNVDPNRLKYGHGFINEQFGEALWWVPIAGDAGQAADVCYSEHYLEQKDPRVAIPHGRRSYPFTAAGLFTEQTTLTWDDISDQWDMYAGKWDDIENLASFPTFLVGDENGNLWIGNRGVNAGGVAQRSFVHFGRRPTAEGKSRNLIWRIYPIARDPTGVGDDLMVTTYLSDHGHGPVAQDGTQSFLFPLAEGGHFVTVRRRARFAEIEFSMETLNGTWGLEGYDWDIRPGGWR